MSVQSLGLVTLGVGLLAQGVTGNATMAFMSCGVFLGAGLQFGDRFLGE